MSIIGRLGKPTLPAIPQRPTQQSHDAVKATLETMRGTRGDPLDRAIFVRDLVELGVIKRDGTLGNAFDINLRDIELPTGSNDTTIPQELNNIQASAGFTSIMLTWDDPHLSNLAYYEIWRVRVGLIEPDVDEATLLITASEQSQLTYLQNNLGNLDAQQYTLYLALVDMQAVSNSYNPGSDFSRQQVRDARIRVTAANGNFVEQATRIGTSVAPVYTDNVDKGVTYMYWVRAITTAGIAGPFNANGVIATTLRDPGEILRELTDEVMETKIAEFIFNGMDLSDYPGFGNSATLNDTLLQQAGWIDDLNAGWGVRISQTINGTKYVSGFGINQEIIGGGSSTFSTFLVAADRFAVVNPNTTNPATAPFIIDNGVTYINSAMIKKAGILELIAGSVTADFLKSNVGIYSAHINASTINYGTFSQPNPNDPTTWVYNPNTGRQGNFSVDANGIMQAYYAELQGIVVKDTKGNIVLDTYNNTYQNAMVSRSNPINASNVGTFISNLAVGSLHIQGQAVTVPVSNVASPSLGLTTAYASLVPCWFTVSSVTGLASVDTNIPVIIMWAVEASAQTANPAARQFRIRQYSGAGNLILYETFTAGRDLDQFSSGIVKGYVNAGTNYTFYVEGKGSGTVYKASIYIVAVRR